MISRDSAADITRDADLSRFTAGLWDQSTVGVCGSFSGMSRAITFPL